MLSVVGRLLVVVGIIAALVMLEAWLGSNQPVTPREPAPKPRVYAVIVYPDMEVWLYEDGSGYWAEKRGEE
jgi:hypothetical protein